MADSDGFIAVRSRRKGTQQKGLPSVIDTDPPCLPYSQMLRSVTDLRAKLNVEAVLSLANNLTTACCAIPRTTPPDTPDSTGSDSPTFHTGTESSLSVTSGQDDLSSVRYIVCYGLGSPSSNRNSRAQTALLLHLQQLCPAASVLLYDPVFCTADENLFASYGFKVEHFNEECARCTSGQRTLFYMPHCSWEMYNNLLWANWSAEELSNVIVIGNDVRDLNSFLPDSRFRRKYSYLHAALRQGLAELWRIPHLTAHNTEFVCSAVMWFPRARLQQQVEALWADCERPEYGEDCVELVKATKTSTTDDSEQECLQSLKL